MKHFKSFLNEEIEKFQSDNPVLRDAIKDHNKISKYEDDNEKFFGKDVRKTKQLFNLTEELYTFIKRNLEKIVFTPNDIKLSQEFLKNVDQLISDYLRSPDEYNMMDMMLNLMHEILKLAIQYERKEYFRK